MNNSANVYYLSATRLKSFESFAETEALVQTKNCVLAIKSWEALIPPFYEPGTEEFLEYNIRPPDSIAQGSGIKFPIRPDALLIHEGKFIHHNNSKKEVFNFNRGEFNLFI